MRFPGTWGSAWIPGRVPYHPACSRYHGRGKTESIMNLLEKDGFEFAFDPDACRQCAGNCCRGESGKIWITTRDMKRISRFLGVPLREFKECYIYVVDSRFSLVEIPANGGLDCVFFDAKSLGCSIYPVRPAQCRLFPFWEGLQNRTLELMQECPGIRQLPNGRDCQ